MVSFVSFSTVTFASDLYYYTDEDGVVHIVDKAPIEALDAEGNIRENSGVTTSRELKDSGQVGFTEGLDTFGDRYSDEGDDNILVIDDDISDEKFERLDKILEEELLKRQGKKDSTFKGVDKSEVLTKEELRELDKETDTSITTPDIDKKTAQDYLDKFKKFFSEPDSKEIKELMK